MGQSTLSSEESSRISKQSAAQNSREQKPPASLFCPQLVNQIHGFVSSSAAKYFLQKEFEEILQPKFSSCIDSLIESAHVTLTFISNKLESSENEEINSPDTESTIQGKAGGTIKAVSSLQILDEDLDENFVLSLKSQGNTVTDFDIVGTQSSAKFHPALSRDPWAVTLKEVCLNLIIALGKLKQSTCRKYLRFLLEAQHESQVNWKVYFSRKALPHNLFPFLFAFCR